MARTGTSTAPGRRGLRSGLVTFSGDQCQRVREGVDELLFGAIAGGHRVEVKVYSAYVEIWHQAKCVARHERCYERHKKVLELEHYLDALTKAGSPGRLDGAGAMPRTRTLAGQLRPVLGGAETAGGQAGGNASHDRRSTAGPRAWRRTSAASRGRGVGTGLFEWGAVRYLLNVNELKKASRMR